MSVLQREAAEHLSLKVLMHGVLLGDFLVVVLEKVRVDMHL